MRKGQKVPEYSVEKMRETKRLRHLFSLDLKSFQDGHSDKAPSHRKQRHISIEEYHSLLEKGYKRKDFIAVGVSGHFIGFMNAMMKGKIKLSKEQFVEDYAVKKIQLNEIAKKYKIQREFLTFLREYYGVKRQGSRTYIRDKREKNIPFTEKQKKVSIGSLLGDAKFVSNGKAVGFGHGGDQEKYCKWKHDIFKDHTEYKSLRMTKSYDERYDKINYNYSFHTVARKEIYEIYKLMCVNNVKTINQELLNLIDEFSFAIWFMDDGSTDWGYRKGIKKYNVQPQSKLMTCNFSVNENLLIKDWLKEKWDIDSRLAQEETKHYMVFNTEATKIIINIIKPHVIPCMQYKVDEKKYVEMIRNKESNYVPTKTKFLNLSNQEQQKIINNIFHQYRKTGFPYINLSYEKIKTCLKKMPNVSPHYLKNKEGNIKHNNSCFNVIKHFQPHVFNMSRKGSLTPITIFNNDDLLKDAIYRRLSRAGPCTPSGMRSILQRYDKNIGVSNFPPSVAKYIFDTECSFEYDVIDFCAGFGGRLLGALSSVNVKSYTCIDPMAETCQGLEKIKNAFFNYVNNKTHIQIINDTAENYKITNHYDMIFTSPPYFDLEIYEKSDNQCYELFDNYDVWCKKWMIPVLRKYIKYLNQGGKLILSVGEYKKEKMINKIITGITDLCHYAKTIYMESGVSEYLRKYKTKKVHDIYVFIKN